MKPSPEALAAASGIFKKEHVDEDTVLAIATIIDQHFAELRKDKERLSYELAQWKQCADELARAIESIMPSRPFNALELDLQHIDEALARYNQLKG